MSEIMNDNRSENRETVSRERDGGRIKAGSGSADKALRIIKN